MACAYILPCGTLYRCPPAEPSVYSGYRAGVLFQEERLSKPERGSRRACGVYGYRGGCPLRNGAGNNEGERMV